MLSRVSINYSTVSQIEDRQRTYQALSLLLAARESVADAYSVCRELSFLTEQPFSLLE